jgi:hypothetical protein
MADELMIQTRILFEKGDVKVSQGPTTLVLDVAGTDAIRATQEIGFAAAEAINKGEITTPGYMWVRNLDPTNFVEIGYDDTGFKNVVKLKAGEEALFRLAQTTPQAQADTAAVRIEYIIIED